VAEQLNQATHSSGPDAYLAPAPPVVPYSAEHRDKIISDFRRQATITAALIQMEFEVAEAGETQIEQDKLFYKIRKFTKMDIPDTYLESVIEVWSNTRWAVEASQLHDNYQKN
jgi:hypothetical protein